MYVCDCVDCDFTTDMLIHPVGKCKKGTCKNNESSCQLYALLFTELASCILWC